MAFAAAARRSLASRRLSDHLARCLHPALPHLFPASTPPSPTSHSTGDPRKPSPLPPPPAPRPFHFALSPSGTAQTLNLLPFGLHLAGPPRRSFSSSSSSPRDLNLADVLTDAADAVGPAAAAVAAPASFPGEVAWAAEDSSLAVAAVQHLIDAVHCFTGLNWWLSIALSTALLRCVLLILWTHSRKHVYVMRQEIQQTSKLVDNVMRQEIQQTSKLAKDDTSREEAVRAVFSSFKKMGLPVLIPLIVTPYTLITLYIAISNMVENVPSLKGGGAFWFTDLTTPDALYIFPMITSLFLMLTFEHRFLRNLSTGSSHKIDKVRKFLGVLSLLSMPLIATLPQAICCSFVTWSFGSFTERIALSQPAVQKLLFGAPLKRRCSSSDGQKGPTAEDSPSPVKEHEEPVPPETRKSSDARVHRVRDQSDKKSTKDG